jgi:hypothetical protein
MHGPCLRCRAIEYLHFIDSIFLQEQIRIAFQVIQGDFKGLGNSSGHLNGGLYLISLIAANDRSMRLQLFSQIIWESFFGFSDLCEPFTECS